MKLSKPILRFYPKFADEVLELFRQGVDMRILGIDPGLANTGWGIVDFTGHHFRPVLYGTVNTDSDNRLEDRLNIISDRILELAKEHNVEYLSIEDIFFAKNEVSAIGVAKVIGSICYAMHTINVPVSIFTPLQIKMAITGNGRAEKSAVQEMCRLILKMDKTPRPNHAADALAAAICFANTAPTFLKLGIKDKRVGF